MEFCHRPPTPPGPNGSLLSLKQPSPTPSSLSPLSYLKSGKVNRKPSCELIPLRANQTQLSQICSSVWVSMCVCVFVCIYVCVCICVYTLNGVLFRLIAVMTSPLESDEVEPATSSFASYLLCLKRHSIIDPIPLASFLFRERLPASLDPRHPDKTTLLFKG